MNRISLRPMTAAEFEAWQIESRRLYASERMRSDSLTEEAALQLADKSHQTLLPQDLETPHHHLYTAINGDQPVGQVWLHVEQGRAFLYDIVLGAAFQGKGLGHQTMLAIEAAARTQGAKSLGLHVFAHNERARRLYEKLGFVTTSLNLSKDL